MLIESVLIENGKEKNIFDSLREIYHQIFGAKRYVRRGRGGTTRGGSEGRLLTREGAGFGCYQHSGGGGCDQHVATAMTKSVEGRCSLESREVLRTATTVAGSTGRLRDVFFRRDDDNCSQTVSYFYPFGG